MKLLYISFTIVLISLFFFNTIKASQETCLASCSGSDGHCCGCCDSSSGETCHQIPQQATCCAANQEFCGCLSARASCFGKYPAVIFVLWHVRILFVELFYAYALFQCRKYMGRAAIIRTRLWSVLQSFWAWWLPLPLQFQQMGIMFYRRTKSLWQ